MEINFKKYLYIIAILGGICYYIVNHYDFQDAMKYAKKKPDPDWSPRIEYYVGLAYYLRSDYPQAVGAFEQLLADYPTCQYASHSLFRLGTSYDQIPNYPKAREVYEKYMELYPSGGDIDMVKSKYEYVKFK